MIEAFLHNMSSGDFTPSYPLASLFTPQSSHTSHSPPSGIILQTIPTLAIPLEDLLTTWVDDLRLDVRVPRHSFESMSVKTEMNLQDGLSQSPNGQPPSPPGKSPPPPDLFLEALADARRYLPPMRLFEDESAQGGKSTLRVTSNLLQWLPLTSYDPSSASRPGPNNKPQTLSDILNLAEASFGHAFPVLDWNQFRYRANKMRLFHAARESSLEVQKTQRAREIMLSAGSGRPAPPFLSNSNLHSWQADEDEDQASETLAFYSAICAALALGTHEAIQSNQGDAGIPPQLLSAPNSQACSPQPRTPAFWYTLSIQTLEAYEQSLQPAEQGEFSGEYTMDFIWARTFQIRFLGHAGSSIGATQASDGSTGVRTPEIGKLVYNLVSITAFVIDEFSL